MPSSVKIEASAAVNREQSEMQTSTVRTSTAGTPSSGTPTANAHARYAATQSRLAAVQTIRFER